MPVKDSPNEWLQLGKNIAIIFFRKVRERALDTILSINIHQLFLMHRQHTCLTNSNAILNNDVSWLYMANLKAINTVSEHNALLETIK